MLSFSHLDLIALALFAAAWAGYAIALESRIGINGLNRSMDRFRVLWMERLLAREMRMVDGQVMAALQSGSAFFASTSLIAVGGSLTLLRAPEELITLVGILPYNLPTTQAQWEAKTLGLAIIFVYAFFKFAWSYRLFNYVSIMIGSAPPASEWDRPAGRAFVTSTARMSTEAGRHFNRGQRAFFFSLAYLGWFLGPISLMIATAGVVAVMVHRQFASDSLQAVSERIDAEF
jgi:uncharacterized membrane protein